MGKWLLVEDEPDIYEILHHLYDLPDSMPLLFTTGEQAVAWIEAVESNEITSDLPIFALIDLRLPGDIDGVAVGERLQRSPRLRHMPVVLMTAYHLTAAERADFIQRTHAKQLLSKPLPPFRELRALFLDLVERSAEEAENAKTA
ncbi:MAG: response regulator [Chloroflexota bacterium]|nr:response regulator [Chloroflexota bacterium]